jgi:hypothetical protein
MQRLKVFAGIAATVVAIVAAAGFALQAYQHYKYPYGWSHCCDKALANELSFYANDHDGWFPRGENTPEASLSLLYRQEPGIANALRGKTVPGSVVRARLERGELLPPETSGWHYVEGLRKGDDPRLALFWDKAGLGHNGERLDGGGHTVHFVDMSTERVPSDRWDEFIAEQETLRAALKR